MPNVGDVVSNYNRIYVWVQPDASKGPGTWRVSNPDEIAGSIPPPDPENNYQFTAAGAMMVDVSSLDASNTITVSVSMNFINLSDREFNGRTTNEFLSFSEYPFSNASATSTNINYSFNAERPVVVNKVKFSVNSTTLIMWSNNFLNLAFKGTTKKASSLSRKFQTQSKSGSDSIYEFVGTGPINVDTSAGVEDDEELITTSMNFAKLTDRNA